jgi:hypothetical protein
MTAVQQRAACLIVSWTILGAALTGSPVVRAERPSPLGDFEYRGGAAEILEVDRAIERVVRRMNFLVRGYVRRRLREPNHPSARLRIHLSHGMVVIDRPGRPRVAAPVSGTVTRWVSPNGERFDVIHRLTGATLLQRFVGQGGQSDNVFTISDDGQVLTVRSTITNRHLPGTIEFRSTYRRLLPGGR